MTPMKAIRLKCLDCCCESSTEVKLCPAQDCPLWAYRSGHNPARAGVCGKGFVSKEAGSNPNSEAKEAEHDDDE